MTQPTSSSSGATPSLPPSAKPPVDCGPLRDEHPVVGLACDALVKTQMPRAAEAGAPRPQPDDREPARPARKGDGIKLDPRFVPMALFGVGGTGLGIYLMTAVHPLAGFAAIAVSALVARSIAMSMAEQR